MDIYAEFKARLERDVARALRHCQVSGLDVTALNGETRLTIADGQLVHVEMPGDVEAVDPYEDAPTGVYEYETPKPKRKK